jgi:hypothetical protein
MIATIIVSRSIRRLSKKLREEERKRKSESMYVNVVRIDDYRAFDNFEEPNYSKKNIVGVVKPIGKFTSMIMGQKITYLMQHANELKSMGDSSYHKVMMNSHDKTKGRGNVLGG